QPLNPAPNALYAVNGGGWEQSNGAVTNTGGTFVGINRTTRVGSTEYFGIQADVDNSYAGMYIRTSGQNGRPFYGYSVGTGANYAWTEYNGGTGNWTLVNRVVALTVTNNGDLGIGTTAPTTPLDVRTQDTLAIYGGSLNAQGVGVKGYGLDYGVLGDGD